MSFAFFMHSLISKLLRKRGIESVDQLDKDEKQTFEQWQLLLNKEQLSTDDIKNFLQAQLDVIESKWRDFGTENAKKAELIPYHTCYKLLLSAINAPKSARTALEQQLNQMLQQ